MRQGVLEVDRASPLNATALVMPGARAAPQEASPAPLFGRPHRGCRSSYLVSVASKRFRVRFSAPAHMRVRAPWSGHRADAGLVRAASCIEAKITLETDMNGALMTASSRFAIAAALGLVVGVGSARAADLGGNCCADLEERVAELEAVQPPATEAQPALTTPAAPPPEREAKA